MQPVANHTSHGEKTSIGSPSSLERILIAEAMAGIREGRSAASTSALAMTAHPHRPPRSVAGFGAPLQSATSTRTLYRIDEDGELAAYLSNQIGNFGYLVSIFHSLRFATPKSLFEAADQALYDAKRAGRNRLALARE